MLSLQQWHDRYRQQAIWTEQLRRHLYQRCDLTSTKNVLEVGCGSGVITSDLSRATPGNVLGVDIRLDVLAFARMHSLASGWIQADGIRLPFKPNSFDVAFSHFLLLWVQNPLEILAEMTRVTHPGGTIIALAEPDYGGRIDYPPELEILGKKQADALRLQGADPLIGRKLGSLFHQAGLSQVEVGVLGGLWKVSPSPQSLELEWSVLRSDLEDEFSPESLEHLYQADRAAWADGSRILYVPTFYAIGQVA